MGRIWDTCMFFPFGFSRSECAAWVQAWGSVFAVLAAIYVVNRNHRLEIARNEMATQDEIVRRLESTLDLVGGAARVAKKIRDWYAIDRGTRVRRDLQHPRLEVEALLSGLRNVDPLALHGHVAVEGVLVSTAAMQELFELLSRSVFTSEDHLIRSEEQLSTRVGEIAEQLGDRARRLVATIEEFRQRRSRSGTEPAFQQRTG